MSMKDNPNVIRVKFGEEVRKLRLKMGLSQEAFAEKANLHRTYISSIELGKVDISITVAHKVAKALNKPLSAILKTIGT